MLGVVALVDAEVRLEVLPLVEVESISATVQVVEMMSACTGRQRRKQDRDQVRPTWAVSPNRRLSAISFKPSSSRRTTSWPWSSSAAKKLSWRSAFDRRLQDTGLSIRAPISGKRNCLIIYKPPKKTDKPITIYSSLSLSSLARSMNYLRYSQSIMKRICCHAD